MTMNATTVRRWRSLFLQVADSTEAPDNGVSEISAVRVGRGKNP
jgi:hypothetical protein